MKRLAHALLCMTLALGSSLWAQDVTQHTSPDGHRFSFTHMPDADRLAISVAWKGGFANLPRGKENVASLAIDLMLNGGADGRSPDDIRAAFEAMDSGSHLYSDADAIRGFVVAPAKDLQKAAAIANSVLSKPTLDERWFKRVLRKARSNTDETAALVGAQAWNTIRHVTMGDHPLEQAWSWQPLANLDTLTIEDLRNWYEQSFSVNDLVISAAGKGTAEEIAKGLDITLKGLPDQHQRQNFAPLEMRYSGKTILIHRPDEEKSYMAIVGPLPPAAHPDNLALQLAAGVLGQSEQSRLFKAVRGEVRSSYSFGARVYSFTRAQDMLALNGEVDTDKLAQTLAAVEEAYTTFKNEGIGFVEFPFAKRIMLKRIRDNFAKPSTIAFVMTEAVLQNKAIEEALALEAKGNAMGRGAANAAISAHFPDFDQMVKVVVSPDADAIKADCVIRDFSEASACK